MSEIEKQFSDIYDEYIEKIYRFIYVKVNSQEITEDLCSETFSRGWKAFKQNSQNIDNPSAFLYQIARNLIIDHYRQKGKYQTVSTEFVQIKDPNVNLEQKAEENSDLNIVKYALANIKDDYREVITLHYLEDFKISEVARIINKSEGNTRVMLHRALESLRNELNNNKSNLSRGSA